MISRKNNLLIYIVLILTYSTVSYSQEIPKLSSKQMFEDYLYLKDFVINNNPQIHVRKVIQGIDIVNILNTYEDSISSCKNTKEFIFLINKLINLCNDGHFSFAPYLAYNISHKTGKINSKYDKFIWRNINESSLYGEKIFIDSSCFFLAGYGRIKKGKIDTVIAPGSEIYSINGITPLDYFNKSRFMRNDYKWDYYNKYFYHSTPRLNPNDAKRGVFFKIINHKNGKISTHFYKKKLIPKGIIYGGWPKGFYTKRVLYIASNKVLYIRIPKMKNKSYYMSEIPRVASKNQIDKVIIDIRDNGGGSDSVWIEVLRYIIKEPIKTNINYVIRNSADIIESLGYTKDSLAEYTGNLFPCNEYRIIEDVEIISPSTNSINYSGNIYILQDDKCYSAAGSLIAMSQYHDFIINIGQQTGTILGRGVNPVIRVLPNSRYCFTMEPVIDITNCKETIDLFHDSVEIPLKMNLDKWLDIFYNYDNFDSIFLIKYDPWMKKVLNY